MRLQQEIISSLTRVLLTTITQEKTNLQMIFLLMMMILIVITICNIILHVINLICLVTIEYSTSNWDTIQDEVPRATYFISDHSHFLFEVTSDNAIICMSDFLNNTQLTHAVVCLT